MAALAVVTPPRVVEPRVPPPAIDTASLLAGPNSPEKVGALLSALGAGATPADGLRLLWLLHTPGAPGDGLEAREKAATAFAVSDVPRVTLRRSGVTAAERKGTRRQRRAKAAVPARVAKHAARPTRRATATLMWPHSKGGGPHTVVTVRGFRRAGGFGRVFDADVKGAPLAVRGSTYIVKLVCGRRGCGTAFGAAGRGSSDTPEDAGFAAAFLSELAVQATLMADPDFGSGVPRLVRVGRVALPDRSGSGSERPVFVLVMQRMLGDMRDFLRSQLPSPGGLIPWTALRPAVDAVAILLRAFYERYGLAHRDMKFNNVMFAREGAHGQLVMKLIDFGFACLSLGPIRLQGGDGRFRTARCADPQRDLGALLATCYELLPLTHECKVEVRRALALTPAAGAAPLPPSQASARDLVTLLRARASDEKRRPGSAWHTLYDKRGTLWPAISVPGVDLRTAAPPLPSPGAPLGAIAKAPLPA